MENNEIEVTLYNGKKVLVEYTQETGYSRSEVTCFRVGEAMNKRQDLLDIIEACQKELDVIYEHDEK